MRNQNNKTIIKKNKKIITKAITLTLISILALILFFGSWYTIPAGERGIVLTFQKHPRLLIKSVDHSDIYFSSLITGRNDVQTADTKFPFSLISLKC